MKRVKTKENYIALTDQHLYVAESINAIQKQSGLMLEEREFKRIDGNYIVQLDAQSIDFLIDKKRMTNIPWQSLAKKDMSLNYMMYAVLVILCIILIRG